LIYEHQLFDRRIKDVKNISRRKWFNTNKKPVIGKIVTSVQFIEYIPILNCNADSDTLEVIVKIVVV